jgi:hypothetical protein
MPCVLKESCTMNWACNDLQAQLAVICGNGSWSIVVFGPTMSGDDDGSWFVVTSAASPCMCVTTGLSTDVESNLVTLYESTSSSYGTYAWGWEALRDRCCCCGWIGKTNLGSSVNLELRLEAPLFVCAKMYRVRMTVANCMQSVLYVIVVCAWCTRVM